MWCAGCWASACLLAVIGMSLAWIIPALSRGGETQNVNVSREMRDRRPQ